MDDSNQLPSIASELVHKRDSAEALIGAVTPTADGWIAQARLPSDHRFYGDAVGRQAGYHDPIFVLEALRQAGIAASHLLYAVPLDFHYTLRFYEFTVADWSALELSTGTGEFEIYATVDREFGSVSGESVNGLMVSGMAKRNGVIAMRYGGAFGWMSDEKWRLIRAGSSSQAGVPPAAVDPRRVGRDEVRHVAISKPITDPAADTAQASIVVDLGNPTFFDHPLDHVPGGLILEACRQLARSMLGPREAEFVGPSRLRVEFHSFTELRDDCTVALQPDGDAHSFFGQVKQSGLVRATVHLAFAAGGALQ